MSDIDVQSEDYDSKVLTHIEQFIICLTLDASYE